jgi:hypothetical protein
VKDEKDFPPFYFFSALGGVRFFNASSAAISFPDSSVMDVEDRVCSIEEHTAARASGLVDLTAGQRRVRTGA